MSQTFFLQMDMHTHLLFALILVFHVWSCENPSVTIVTAQQSSDARRNKEKYRAAILLDRWPNQRKVALFLVIMPECLVYSRWVETTQLLLKILLIIFIVILLIINYLRWFYNMYVNSILRLYKHCSKFFVDSGQIWWTSSKESFMIRDKSLLLQWI